MDLRTTTGASERSRARAARDPEAATSGPRGRPGPHLARLTGRRAAVARAALFLAAAMLVPRAASAQPAAVAKPGVSIEQASVDDKQLAQSHYDRGVAAYESNDYASALEAFEASYGVVRSPNAHLMIARALIGLERWARAHDELAAVEAEAEGQARYQQAFDKSRELRADVARRIALVRFQIRGLEGPYVLQVRGQPVDASATVALLPGSAVVEVLSGQTSRLRTTVELSTGQTQELDLEVPPLAPPAPPPPPVREEAPSALGTSFYVGAALTGVGIAGFGVATAFGLMAKSSHDELSGLCPDGRCPAGTGAEVDALKSDGSRDQTIHLVGLGVGVAGVATGVTLMIVGATSGDSPEAELGGLRLRPSVGLGFVALDGSF